MRSAAWWVVVAVSLSSCAAHRYECERHGGSPSVRVTSQHFELVGDLPPDDLRFEARRLERLWDAFETFLGARPTKTARIEVLLSQERLATEFIPGTAGFVVGDLDRLMVTTTSREQNTNAHELVHVVVAGAMPALSRWLNEGLAEYLGDAEFKSEYVVRFGRWRWERGLVEPLEALWSWGAPTTSEQEHQHYQSAWAWVSFLSNREEARLREVFARLSAGTPAREAFEAVFPPAENDALLKRAQAYVDEGRFSGWESTLQRDHVLSEATPVAPWEVHLLRRKVFRLVGWPSQARVEARAAAEVAPEPRPERVQVAQLVEEFEGPERTDRLRALPEAATSHEIRLVEATSVDVGPDQQAANLAALVSERPEDPTARLALAQLLLRLDRPGALPLAREATALAPWSREARFTLVTALVREHRCQEGYRALEAARGLIVERAGGATGRLAQLRAQVDACKEQP